MESSQNPAVEEVQKQVEELKVTEKLPYKIQKLYFEDSYLFESTGKIEATWKSDKGDETVLILDKTIFHPQGGGQPADEGYITSQDGKIKFIVKTLQPKDDTILHIGNYEQDGETFEIGQEVKLHIDEDKRRAYAQYHSAGHLLDIAINRLGLGDTLKPGKGYHFTSGAYVEYVGNVDNATKDKLCKDLTEEANKVIQEQKENPNGVFNRMLSYEKAQGTLRDGVPPYIPVGQDLRVIKLTEQDGGCPCGGTHVKHVTDIPYVEVTKVIKKGKNTRVSYTVKNLPAQ